MYGKELLYYGEITTLQAGDVIRHDNITSDLTVERGDAPLFIRDIGTAGTGVLKAHLPIHDLEIFGMLAQTFFRLKITLIESTSRTMKWRADHLNSL